MADKKNSPKEQPDFEDEQATIEWVNDESVSEDERQLRARQVQMNENHRREGARTGLLNAASDVLSREGPPSANQ